MVPSVWFNWCLPVRNFKMEAGDNNATWLHIEALFIIRICLETVQTSAYESLPAERMRASWSTRIIAAVGLAAFYLWLRTYWDGDDNDEQSVKTNKPQYMGPNVVDHWAYFVCFPLSAHCYHRHFGHRSNMFRVKESFARRSTMSTALGTIFNLVPMLVPQIMNLGLTPVSWGSACRHIWHIYTRGGSSILRPIILKRMKLQLTTLPKEVQFRKRR